jgi:hypothetical protein
LHDGLVCIQADVVVADELDRTGSARVSRP